MQQMHIKNTIDLMFEVNGEKVQLQVSPENSLLDVLRHDLVCPLSEISEIITDRRPGGRLRSELIKAAVDVNVVSH